MRQIEGKNLTRVIEVLAEYLVRESGGTLLHALAEIRDAVEWSIEQEVVTGGAEGLLSQVLGGPRKATWREIGADLGISAQAAHRKYGPLVRRRYSSQATAP